jgi:hypothetical protein
MWIYSYQFASNATNQINIDVDNLNLVNDIYNTFHQSMASENYEQFITNTATKNVCDQIN